MILPNTIDTVRKAANLLTKGRLVAFPTETVYGLGADATSDEAVAKIFEVKNRPSFNPLIIHLAEASDVEKLAIMTQAAKLLADAFWPGPISLVLRRTNHCPVSFLASAGLDTVAVRVPSHPIAKLILEESKIPIAAPSANISGKVSPTTAKHVLDSLGPQLNLIVDSGPCEIGLESTVVDCTQEKPAILRPGGVTYEELIKVLGALENRETDRQAPIAPGTMESHYAPSATIRMNANHAKVGEGLLAFGPEIHSNKNNKFNLSPEGNLVEAAANLFSMIRKLDQEYNKIAVMPIPNHGLGIAINDRLQRAAAAR
tara:strand:- start:1388 stop:2332 length:945 start_codon:yes stop_codon:yes gene_type:complete